MQKVDCARSIHVSASSQNVCDERVRQPPSFCNPTGCVHELAAFTANSCTQPVGLQKLGGCLTISSQTYLMRC